MATIVDVFERAHLPIVPCNGLRDARVVRHKQDVFVNSFCAAHQTGISGLEGLCMQAEHFIFVWLILMHVKRLV